jgi:DNA-binding NarL/FixJ family response regulator
MTRVVVLVDDLMDRSRVTAAAPDAVAVRSIDDVADADVVVVDLGKHAGVLADVRAKAPGAFVVAFGRHDDAATLRAAKDAGADRVLARSKFFADVGAAIRPA